MIRPGVNVRCFRNRLSAVAASTLVTAALGCLFSLLLLASPLVAAPAFAQSPSTDDPLFRDPDIPRGFSGQNPLIIPRAGTGILPPQAADAPNLGVRLKTYATGGDAVELYNTGSSLSGTALYNFSRRVGDDLSLPRSAYAVRSPTSNRVSELSDEATDANLPDQVLALKERLVHRDHHNWVLSLNTASLLQTIHLYGFRGVDLSVCGAGVPSHDESSSSPNAVVDGCRTWNQADGSAPLNIRFVETPQPHGLLHVVEILGVIALAFTLIFAGFALWLRQHVLKTLSGGTLVVVVCFAIFSLVTWIAASIALAFMKRPMTDFLFANNIGEGGQFLSVVVLGFMFALPPLVAAVVLARAHPPSYEPDGLAEAASVVSSMQGPSPHAAPARRSGSGAGPGVPRWLMDAPEPSPAPTSAPANPAPSSPIDAPANRALSSPTPSSEEDGGERRSSELEDTGNGDGLPKAGGPEESQKSEGESEPPKGDAPPSPQWRPPA